VSRKDATTLGEEVVLNGKLVIIYNQIVVLDVPLEASRQLRQVLDVFVTGLELLLLILPLHVLQLCKLSQDQLQVLGLNAEARLVLAGLSDVVSLVKDHY